MPSLRIVDRRTGNHMYIDLPENQGRPIQQLLEFNLQTEDAHEVYDKLYLQLEITCDVDVPTEVMNRLKMEDNPYTRITLRR